jgi:PadR family transcriptional regulator, regulatory protein PadR
MQEAGLFTCECRTVDHKQRKYYKITRKGIKMLREVKVQLQELYEEVIREK